MELEAQWKNTEVNGDTIEGLKREKEELVARVSELEAAAPSAQDDEQIAALQRENESLQRDVAELKQNLDDARANVVNSSTGEDNEQIASLKTELEAQWRHAEVSNEEIVNLKAARDGLQAQVAELETCLEALESELDAAREELEQADQLVADKKVGAASSRWAGPRRRAHRRASSTSRQGRCAG